MGSCFVEFLFSWCIVLYGCLSDVNLMFYTCWHPLKEKTLLQVLCYALQYTKTFMLFDILLLLCCLSDAITYVSYMVIMFMESLNNYSRGSWITAAGKKAIGLSIQLIIYQLPLSLYKYTQADWEPAAIPPCC